MTGAGLTPPDAIHADGHLHRFATNGKRGDAAGWYCLHGDGLPAGAFGDWRQGFAQNWCAKADSAMTQQEREEHRQRMQQIQAQRDAEQSQRHASARARAQQQWDDASPAGNHPYLVAKGVQGHGLRQTGDVLLVPLRDTSGTLHSLQTIDANGNKRFLSGGKVQGCYHAIGKPDGCIVVCEGFATGASIHAATGHAVACAMNASNLQAVAQTLHAKYPALRIVVAADDDYATTGNPGLTAARQAALSVGGMVAVPLFDANRPTGATDFNDLHQAQGLEAIHACITAAQAVAANDAKAGALPDRVTLLSAADMRPEPIRWLWYGWLAQGKFHLLAGAPGVGKTTLTLALAATVSMGGKWPDGSQCTPGNVLVWSGEDDVADTLLPRLIAAGADAKRVHFVGEAHRKGEKAPFNLARDIPLLEQAVRQIGGIRLLIVDPVAGAVTGDSHKGNEVRNGLQPLVDFASTTGCAVLGITHFGKGGQGGDPTNRVLGSVAFAAVARVVLVAAKAKDADGRPIRIIARSKGNVTPDDGGYQYHLEQMTIDGGIETTAVLWGNKVEGTARELLTDPDAPEDDASDVADAASMLGQLLVSDCWTPAKDASKELADAGFTKKQIRNARKKLAVISKKGGMHGGWYWRLPHGSDPDLPTEDALLPPEDAQGAHFLKQGILGTFGTKKGTFGENPNTETGPDFVEETL